MQSVIAGTLNLSGVINSALFQTGQTMNVPTMKSWKDPQIYLSRTALGKSSLSHYDITDFVTRWLKKRLL